MIRESGELSHQRTVSKNSLVKLVFPAYEVSGFLLQMRVPVVLMVSTENVVRSSVRRIHTRRIDDYATVAL